MTEFILNGELVRTIEPTSFTLLDYIRYRANLRGTKIGCREGDCGACTVLIGRSIGNEVFYESATSCLTPLGNAHGKHIVTVEGLNMENLNRVQQAMVDFSGTQCGICTPGFVVSLCGYVLNPQKELYRSAKDAVDGNICRCTGYKSIERAAERIDSELANCGPGPRLNSLVSKGFVPEYFLGIASRLNNINPPEIMTNGRKPVGGGTDVYVQMHDRLQTMEIALLARDESNPRIEFRNGQVIIDKAATATDLMKSVEFIDAIPGWYDYMKLISSQPIRNIGTIAGNLVNASPIGDFTIVLLALGAELEIENQEGSLRKVLLKDFYFDYKKTDLKPGEIISRIFVSLPGTEKFHFEKVCKRQYLDIASVNTAIKVDLEGDTITGIDLSVGGVSAVPLYLRATSAFLSGKKLNPENIVAAELLLQNEISPISDARGSADYKRLLASRLFFAHFIHLFPKTIKMEELV
ncbi:MAG: (2Fe-2S)-binding protein [Saprospirales bacterium]|nr:MAG: (2Fe-2S)-binding protein [Saprospirales bacterium]